MNVKLSEVVNLFDDAAEAAEALIAALASPGEASNIDALFEALADGLLALPPNPAEDCYLRNTTGDAAALFAAGEPGAAKWQVEQVVRRLRRLRDSWMSGCENPSVSRPLIPHVTSARR